MTEEQIEQIREDHEHECPMCHYGIGQFCSTRALLAEVDRLRAAIEQHRQDMWDRLLDGPSDAPADARLYAALDGDAPSVPLDRLDQILYPEEDNGG